MAPVGSRDDPGGATANMLHIYHERQLGKLCGVHCVNNLLQSPRFGPGDLAEIAIRLDKKERRLLGGDDPRDVDRSAGNVDAFADGGNFSIQVLRVALLRAGVKLLPADHPESKDFLKDPTRGVSAYLVQRVGHWLTWRSVGPCWWDLDSTLERPMPLNEANLARRLQRSLGDRRSSVFLVVGAELLMARPPVGASFEVDSNWHNASELLQGSNMSTSVGADARDVSVVVPSNSVRSKGTPTSSKSSPLRSSPCLDGFGEHEMQVGLALTGGCEMAAAEVLAKARLDVKQILNAPPHELAQAWASAVSTVLTAQRTLSDAVARLVVLLCSPPEETCVNAAEFVDCAALAHRLLTTLTKKARGWFWTKELEQAATVVVERLLALPAASSDLITVDKVSTARGDAAVASGLSGRSTPQRERDAVFEALDGLLQASVPDEGRPMQGRLLVSAPGLKLLSPPKRGARVGPKRRRASKS
eukprot:TRINITY_DN56168_c0_g1_i1.p1 TRINITY_DN56168_c0_g1~~TRINITY_DN56168_c0_g1_i1.p1  ORF type:complete len:474 (-),score=77.47 TRINITY_DN56168_c0_g1_i1:748-2169(-)